MRKLFVTLWLFPSTIVVANELLHAEHAPFKERLWTGPGYTPGVGNVLRGYLESGWNAETLVSPNIVTGKQIGRAHV